MQVHPNYPPQKNARDVSTVSPSAEQLRLLSQQTLDLLAEAGDALGGGLCSLLDGVLISGVHGAGSLLARICVLVSGLLGLGGLIHRVHRSKSVAEAREHLKTRNNELSVTDTTSELARQQALSLSLARSLPTSLKCSRPPVPAPQAPRSCRQLRVKCACTRQGTYAMQNLPG